MPEGKDKHGNTIVARGAWGEWLEEVNIPHDNANKMIRIFEEIGEGKSCTYMNKGLRALYEIATLPPNQRDVLHELPSGETKKPDEMTVRELRELKRQLRQAEQQAEAERKDFLRQKESNMRQIVGKAYTELGKELYEAQQRLASHNKYEGVFVKWCGYLGFTMKQVYRLIDRYNLLTNCQNSEQKEFLEDLPVSLAYEISGKSSESTPEKAQAKAEVLAGDIATLKEYRERIKELERKAEQAEQEAE